MRMRSTTPGVVQRLFSDTHDAIFTRVVSLDLAAVVRLIAAS